MLSSVMLSVLLVVAGIGLVAYSLFTPGVQVVHSVVGGLAIGAGLAHMREGW